MTRTYDSNQTTFILSLLSNRLAGQFGFNMDKRLLDAINQDLAVWQPHIGSWSVIWGPSVYQVFFGSSPMNAMYVAINQDATELVVAIAGTNPYSVCSWLYENLDVGNTVPWGMGAPEGAAISAGSHRGLSILRAMRPAWNVTSPRMLLIDFLKERFQNATEKVNVTVTGHSLGGALAPLLGLWLKNQQTSWDPRGQATVKVWASAGPTPGVDAFSRYYDAEFGGTTTRYWNSLDIVPHAWAVDAMDQIPSLYMPHIEVDPDVQSIVRRAKELTNEHPYQHILPGAPAQQGTINTSIIKPGDSNRQNFIAQALYQHVQAYYTFLEIEVPTALMSDVREVSPETIVDEDTVDRNIWLWEQALAPATLERLAVQAQRVRQP